tara:strand:- start:10903 stop:11193 length:291 start_codon:yes stop_codon:yes gene_type:complete
MEKQIADLTDKIDKIYDALLGDRLDRKEGYLDQIDSNTENIKSNTNDIIEIKKNNKKNARTRWDKIGLASGAGMGLGGVGAAKGGSIIKWVIDIFA